MKDYNELELALTENPLNLESLMRAFFPPNEPPSPFVEVVYWITSGTIDPDQQRLLQGMQGPPRSSDDTFWNISEYDTWYKYWWSESPIYLFMDSGILERLALFTISVPYHTAQIFINRSFCEDYTIQNIPLPQYHLNQMTTLVSASGAAILINGFPDKNNTFWLYACAKRTVNMLWSVKASWETIFDFALLKFAL